jgi:hypothetical protein
LQLARLLRQFPPARRRPGWREYCLFLVLSKWPELWGQLLFITRTIRGREQTIIEYK